MNAPNVNPLPHTAITSWSGFAYQGKAALFHVLNLIVEDKNHCKYFKLQLDSLDDFAILSPLMIVSLHQVKAKKSQNYSTYSADVAKLKQRAAELKCNNAFFHTSRKIIDKTDSELIAELAPAKIYSYGSEGFCAVDNIDSQIEAKLKEYWGSDAVKSSDAYVALARQHLDQIILNQVLRIHGIIQASLKSETQAAFEETIPFAKFLEILDHYDLMQIGQDQKYWVFILLNDMHQYYQEFCVEKDSEFSADIDEKLSSYMQAISQLTHNELVQFIRNIVPQRKIKLDSLSDYKNHTFCKDGFRWAFLEILRVLKATPLNDKALFQWTKSEKHYFPSTIVTGPSTAQNVCVEIFNNFKMTDLEVLFERSNIITSDIEVASIADAIHSVLSIEQDSDVENYEHRITSLKTVSLVSLNTIKGEIND